MEKIHENGDVSVGRVIMCSPTQLRIIADRLEVAASQRAFPRDKCVYEIVPGIMLQYEPNITRSALLAKIGSDILPDFSENPINANPLETHLQ